MISEAHPLTTLLGRILFIVGILWAIFVIHRSHIQVKRWLLFRAMFSVRMTLEDTSGL